MAISDLSAGLWDMIKSGFVSAETAKDMYNSVAMEALYDLVFGRCQFQVCD